jgi:hypothetical protein
MPLHYKLQTLCFVLILGYTHYSATIATALSNKRSIINAFNDDACLPPK